jgi:hypothetical protein
MSRKDLSSVDTVTHNVNHVIKNMHMIDSHDLNLLWCMVEMELLYREQNKDDNQSPGNEQS